MLSTKRNLELNKKSSNSDYRMFSFIKDKYLCIKLSKAWYKFEKQILYGWSYILKKALVVLRRLLKYFPKVFQVHLMMCKILNGRPLKVTGKLSLAVQTCGTLLQRLYRQ